MTMKEEGYRRTREEMREYYPRFSDSEYKRRYDLIYDMMDQLNLACLLIYGDTGTQQCNQQHVHYVTNYIDELYSYVVFPRRGDPTLWVSIPPDQAAAMACAVIADVRAGGMSTAIAAKVAQRLKEHKLDGQTIGIVDNFSLVPGLPSAHYALFTSELPQAEFVNVTSKFEWLKAIPSVEELEWLRNGVELTDFAADAMIEAVEVGKTEGDVWAAIHSAYLKRGGCLCFSIIGATAMASPSMSYPHGISNMPATRPISQGDIIFAEISASYYGYPGQCFCVVALGEPPDNYLEMYEFALELYNAIAKVLRPGNTDEEVLKIGRRITERGLDIEGPLVHGWGTHFGAPAMGLERWTPEPTEFRAGQLIVIEPNPCTPDALMGLQIGNLTQVTPEGAVPLHRRGTELIVKE